MLRPRAEHREQHQVAQAFDEFVEQVLLAPAAIERGAEIDQELSRVTALDGGESAQRTLGSSPARETREVLEGRGLGTHGEELVQEGLRIAHPAAHPARHRGEDLVGHRAPLRGTDLAQTLDDALLADSMELVDLAA